MEKQKSNWQDVFKIIAALHSETKIIILHTIKYAQQQLNINEIVQLTNLKRPNISKQLKDLLQIGVLAVEQKGRERFYQFESSLNAEKLSMIEVILKAYQNCSCSEGKLSQNQ